VSEIFTMVHLSIMRWGLQSAM